MLFIALPLRTAVLMKADIAGFTLSFRALVANDLQSLLLEHRALVSRHADAHGGSNIQRKGSWSPPCSSSVLELGRSSYTMSCPARLQEFSLTRWRDELGRSSLHYLPLSWSRRWARLTSG